jgi:hypothetical protein
MTDLLYHWTPELMVEVRFSEPDDFLKIRETLTRIGISSTKEANTIYQSCHILHKQGRYFIVHFKELFLLDGRPSDFTVSDVVRRNTIAALLQDWGLLQIVDSDALKDGLTDLQNIKIVKYSDKKNWDLRAKYAIGNYRGTNA